MADFTSLRRYCLYKGQNAALVEEDALVYLWRNRQLAEPGTALPDGFPSKTTLAAAGYVADSDLTGADVDELIATTGLSRRDAEAVLAAHAAL